MSKMNPVVYAENVLHVHSVFTEAREHVAALEGAANAMVASMQQLRSLREQLADRENVIAVELRRNHPDASQAAIDREFKSAVQADTDHSVLRDQLRLAQADHDRLEAQVDTEKRQIDVLSSRMHQLGGLLNFYAEAKRAEAMAAMERVTTPLVTTSGDSSNSTSKE